MEIPAHIQRPALRLRTNNEGEKTKEQGQPMPTRCKEKPQRMAVEAVSIRAA
jgi:hypothetical protein